MLNKFSRVTRVILSLSNQKAATLRVMNFVYDILPFVATYLVAGNAWHHPEIYHLTYYPLHTMAAILHTIFPDFRELKVL